MMCRYPKGAKGRNLILWGSIYHRYKLWYTKRLLYLDSLIKDKCKYKRGNMQEYKVQVNKG